MPAGSPPTAMDRVFAIPELLELILHHVPARDLLLLQRTSHAWHATISTSPAIQKALFMRPDWTLEGRYATDRPGARPLNNLMLRQVMGGMYPTMTLLLHNFATRDEFDAARRDVNAADMLVTTADDDDDDEPSYGFWAWNVNVSIPADALLSAQATRPAVAYEAASWRRMLVSQPPATALHLTRRWRRAEAPAVEVATGITMRDLVEAAGRSDKRWSEVYIGSDRDWHLEGPIKYSHFPAKKPAQ